MTSAISVYFFTDNWKAIIIALTSSKFSSATTGGEIDKVGMVDADVETTGSIVETMVDITRDVRSTKGGVGSVNRPKVSIEGCIGSIPYGRRPYEGLPHPYLGHTLG